MAGTPSASREATLSITHAAAFPGARAYGSYAVGSGQDYSVRVLADTNLSRIVGEYSPEA